jgi:hypothetical protein
MDCVVANAPRDNVDDNAPPTAVIPREGGVSSTPYLFDSITSALEYWMPAFAGMTGRYASAFSQQHPPEFANSFALKK